MKPSQVIKALANGRDPKTHIELTLEALQHPEVIAVLHQVKQQLEISELQQAHLTPDAKHSRRAWSPREDLLLSDAFDCGQTIPELAKAHGRSEVAIHARLTKHGKFKPPMS